MELLTAIALLGLLAASAVELSGLSRTLRVGYWLSAAAAAIALVVSVWCLAEGSAVSFEMWSVAPGLTLAWRMDGLGAVLGGVIALVALFASVFAVGYSHPRRTDDAVYPLFILSMLGVAGAGNVFTFFTMWEAMALASFLLVLGDGQSRPQRTAALLYLGMTHVATVLAVASWLLLSDAAGSQDFQVMAAAQPTGVRASLALCLAFVGFGTKAGLVPLHIWLPRAHPVAPSHVSALMSAAMVATGVFGLTRTALSFLGPGEAWWGIALMLAGATTAVLGVLYALMERDMKRCLAYSTVENMGIVTVALGASVSFRAAGLPAASGAALLAGLVHLVNHAVLKSVLFLGAGAIQTSAHSLDMDHLGGLLRAMPLTGLAMLVGALGLASVPPLNGFVGEWMLARSLFSLAGSDAGIPTGLAASVAVGALALTAGLALACFVRLFGMTFLGLPRTAAAVPIRDAPPLMALPMLGLAALAIVAGLGAAGLVRLLRGVPDGLIGSTGVDAHAAAHRVVLASGGSFSPAVAAAAIAILALLPWLVLRAAFGANRRDRGPIWATGGVFLPGMQYTATSLSKPLRIFFRRILLPERTIRVDYHGASLLPRRVQYRGRVPATIEERFYLPLRTIAIWSAGRIRGLQNGSVELYLLYIFVALVALLAVAR